ncbi:MAG: DUF1116 domain-containing protein [Actinobacteria bacterium]|nr:DUF1116 domain-containing protein [Actinomycetota bacterium]
MTGAVLDGSPRTRANQEAFRRIVSAEPVLREVRPAGEVLPGMTRDLVLTSGAPLPWSEYVGGQREAIIGGALFEGLAADREEAIRKLDAGEIRVGACHDHDCVGSLAGIYTWSMPVFVVENAAGGNVGYCNFYEGNEPKRLNYGVYDDEVRDRLRYVNDVVAPVLDEAIRRTGGVPLRPIMRRALQMGDELHSRNTAGTLLFTHALTPALTAMAAGGDERVLEVLQALDGNDYFFLRLSMAAAKASADAARGVEGASVVTAMAFSCRGFSIRVSGLGDAWLRGPHATVQARLFEGHTEDEIAWMGGESPITETVGLGGFAQAAAFCLQRYQGGSPEVMVERNLEMYEITVGEHPHFLIPFLQYRGTPTGIDVARVLETGILPLMDIGIAGRDGGQIGAGVIRAPIECFVQASDRLAAG